MKVSQGANQVLESGGLQQSVGFKIKANAHAFRMLSSGLYADKVSAVLREIGCNGHDAHVAAGRPSHPLDVKLPNGIDPQFYIRDYGTGLSDDQVKHLYTTYFESTKQDSDEYTGAFGLGSKSPFSYTDSFTVVACHGGKKRIYSAHIDNKTGSPSIAMMSESAVDPDWATGVQIGFPVKPQDFSEFTNKAREVFQFFSVPPKIIGAPAVKPVEYEVNRADYGFLKSADAGRNRYGMATPIAIMGNVHYPIDLTKLGLHQYQTDTSILEHCKGLHDLVLKFKIGAVQVAASREQLQYDPASIKVIKERLKKVLIDIGEEIRVEYDKVATWKDTIAFIALGKSMFRGIAKPAEFLKDSQITKGKEIAAVVFGSMFRLPNESTDKAFMRVMYQDMKSPLFKLSTKMPNGSHFLLEYEDNLTIVHGAEDRAYARIRQALQAKELEGRILLIATNEKMKGTDTDTDAIFAKVEKYLVGVPVRDLMEFIPPPQVKVSKRKGVSAFPNENVIMDGGLIKIADIPDDRKVYVATQVRSSWGRTKTTWLGKDTQYEDYRQDQILAGVTGLAALITLPHSPVEILNNSARRYKMSARADWKEYTGLLAEKLEDPVLIKKLEAISKQSSYTVELSYRGQGELGALENLVHMMEKQPHIIQTLEPTLRKHGIYDTIKAVHKDSKAPSASAQEPPELTAYRNLVSALGLKLPTPTYQKAVNTFNSKHTKLSALPYYLYSEIYKVDPTMFVDFIDQLLQKG